MACYFLLYNKVKYLYMYIYPHISYLLHLPPILPFPPLQVVTKHGADLPVLCGCFPLVIYFTFGSIYMSMPLSHFVSAYPSPSQYPQVHFQQVCIFIPILSLGSSDIIFSFFFFFFRFHIQVLAYNICFSLSDLLHSVWQSLGQSTSLQITQFSCFVWLSNIPLYICATSSLSIHLLMDTQVASMSWLL